MFGRRQLFRCGFGMGHVSVGAEGRSARRGAKNRGPPPPRSPVRSGVRGRARALRCRERRCYRAMVPIPPNGPSPPSSLSLSLHLISSSLFLSSPLLTRPIPYPPSKPIDRYPFLSIRRPDLVSLGSVANCMSSVCTSRKKGEREEEGWRREGIRGRRSAR